MQSPGSTKYLESHKNHESRWILMQRRGQDSNLQSSGHEPDELTNSSTPLLLDRLITKSRQSRIDHSIKLDRIAFLYARIRSEQLSYPTIFRVG